MDLGTLDANFDTNVTRRVSECNFRGDRGSGRVPDKALKRKNRLEADVSLDAHHLTDSF